MYLTKAHIYIDLFKAVKIFFYVYNISKPYSELQLSHTDIRRPSWALSLSSYSLVI